MNQTFSNDMLFKIALEYDMPTLLNFCKSSSKINKLVCDNNLFWFYKLRKDYKVDGNIANAKEYYKYLYERIKNTDINHLYLEAIEEGNLDLVKITLDRGADINFQPSIHSLNDYPLVKALKTNDEIAEYIIERNPFENRVISIRILSQILIYLGTLFLDRDRKIKLVTLYYDKIFPKTYEFFKGNKAGKNLFKEAVIQLENNRAVMEDLYNRRINELQILAAE